MPLSAFASDLTGYDKYYADNAATAGIPMARLVVWNSQDEKRESLKTQREIDAWVPVQMDLDKNLTDEQKKLGLATLNKTVESLYAKQAAPATQHIQPEQMKLSILNFVISTVLGVPKIADDKYDTAAGVMSFYIVSGDFGADPRLKVPVSMKLTAAQAQGFRENANRLRPNVLFDFANNVLTAKYVMFNTDVLDHLQSAAISSGVPVNVKLSQIFGAASLATYDSDVRASKAAADSARDDSMKSQSWYSIFSRFLDAPSQCSYLKQQIRLAGTMNGANAAGQANTLNYAKSIATQYPKCLK